MIEASYVGNRNTPEHQSRTELHARGISQQVIGARQTAIDFLGRTFPNPYLGLNPIYGSTITRGNLLKNYSQFSAYP
jgi:hypothetical protein